MTTHACTVCGADMGWARPTGCCSMKCLHSVMLPAGHVQCCECHNIVDHWCEYAGLGNLCLRCDAKEDDQDD